MPRCKAVHLNMCTVPPPFPYAVVGLVFALPNWLSSRLLKWYFSPEEYRQMIRSKDFALKGAGYFGMQATQVSYRICRVRQQFSNAFIFGCDPAIYNWFGVE